jgi:uncharacterized protein
VIDDIFVFDAVIHALDMSDENTLDNDVAQFGRDHLLRITSGLNNGTPRLAWTPEDLYDMVFVNSPVDLAVAQTVPLFDFFEDGFAPVKAQYEMARKYPERVIFCGGVDPSWHGMQDALDQIEYQINELGATTMKFYNAHVEGSWRCDDEKIAYPLYEKIRSLGVNVIQFHKGVPLGKQSIEPLSPLDLQKAARDFPDMTFIVHHLSIPPLYYFDQLCAIASRFPNIYVALSGTMSFFYVAPYATYQQMGRLLMEVGAEKLLWGSEAALAGSPNVSLKAMVDFQIPDELRSNFGYPQITDKEKELILGRNMARLLDIDIDAKQAELANVARAV